MARIAVVGSVNADMVIRVPRLPVSGETVVGDLFEMYAGGKGANQAVAAARLGAEVVMIGRVGDDAHGRQARRLLLADSIETTHLLTSPDAPTGVALITVDSAGQNTIALAAGANGLLSAADVRQAAEAIADADALLLQFEVPVAAVQEAIRIAREHGTLVVLNPAPAVRAPRALFASADVLTPNESEAAAIMGNGHVAYEPALLTDFSDLTAAAVVVTRGGAGVTFVGADGPITVPAHVVDVVDTTGAGDAFNGALAVGLADGKTLNDSVTFANAAGALAVTRKGAHPSMPRATEVLEFLQAQQNQSDTPQRGIHR